MSFTDDDLRHTSFDSRTFTHTDLSNRTLRSVEFDGCTFDACVLSHTRFDACSFADCTFTDCDLTLASVVGTSFDATVFRSCRLMGVDWSGTGLHFDVELVGCNLDYTSFQGKTLRGQVFDGCTVVEANFTRTGPTTYSGTRDDVLGETTVRISGNTAHFTYRVDLDPDGKPNIVRFFDTLVLKNDGTLRNTALVTKFALPVARVKINFARSLAKAKAIRP